FMSIWHSELVEVVFAGKFGQYSPLLALVFFFAAINSIDIPVTLVAQLKEKAHIILASRIFSLYNIGALLLLIPRLGIAGAMLATGSAAFMKHLFVWWFVRDLAAWKDAWGFLARTAIAWAPFAALSLLARTLLSGQPWLALPLAIVMWLVTFTVYLR